MYSIEINHVNMRIARSWADAETEGSLLNPE